MNDFVIETAGLRRSFGSVGAELRAQDLARCRRRPCIWRSVLTLD